MLAHLEVRSRTPSDDDAIRSLSSQVFAIYSRRPERSVGSMAVAPGAATFVAEVGGQVVGFVIVSLERHRRDYGPLGRPMLARLDAIAVHPAAQGRGVGQALLTQAIEEAQARRAVSLSLSTAVDNRRARKLFEKAGFLTTVKLDAYYAGGQSAVAMFKPLELPEAQ